MKSGDLVIFRKTSIKDIYKITKKRGSLSDITPLDETRLGPATVPISHIRKANDEDIQNFISFHLRKYLIHNFIDEV